MILTLEIIGCILVLALIFIIIGLAFKPKRNKNVVNQITKNEFYVNTDPKTNKWWVSKNGLFEKKWMEVQDYEFPVKYFDYKEHFSKGFCSSRFVRTKVFLNKIMDINTASYTLNELKNLAICFENVWWIKYRKECQKAFNDLGKYSKAPEYFFYKYYFIFISKLRKKMIYYFCQFIIPSVIISKLNRESYKKYNIDLSIDFDNNIIFAFNQLANEADSIYNNTIDEAKKELQEKGKDWKIDYDDKNKKVALFLPQEIVVKTTLLKKARYLTAKPTQLLESKNPNIEKEKK